MSMDAALITLGVSHGVMATSLLVICFRQGLRWVVPGSNGQIKFGTPIILPRQHIWRNMEKCCSPWSPWWSDAMALAGYTTDNVVEHKEKFVD